MSLFLHDLKRRSDCFSSGKMYLAAGLIVLGFLCVEPATAAENSDATIVKLSDSSAGESSLPKSSGPVINKKESLPGMQGSGEAKEDYFGVKWGEETPEEMFSNQCGTYFSKLKSLQFPPCGWTIDYRLRSYCSSQTSYEIGTPDDMPSGWAPLSMLRFGLDSPWHGLAVGYNQPNWDVQFEWMTPISNHINGELADYDWDPPNSDSSFTDLGIMRERWNDGQTLQLRFDYHLSDRLFNLPVEVWPLVEFRWQRYSLTAYQLDQILYQNVWAHRLIEGDIISFNQQYYMCCVGTQFRKNVMLFDTLPMRLTFQGDWGATWGYNVDHHILRDLWSTMGTQGSSWHIGVTAEAPFSDHLSLGLQVDYLNIRTTGTEHYYSAANGVDLWRSNGVCAYSDQTTLTVFLQLRM